MASASPPSRTWMHARNASGTYRTMTPGAPSPLSTSYPATSYPGRTASPYYASQYQSLSNGHGHPSTGSSYPTSASPHPQWSSYYARPNPQRSATMTPGPYAANGGKPRPIPIPSRNFSATPAPAPVRRVSVSAVPRPASTRPNVETPKPIPPSDWTNPFKDLVYYRQLLAGNRKCCVCSRTLAVNPTITMNADPTRLTHISCPDCRIIQCRGCSTQRPDCTPHCSQQTKCSALDCCPEVRAIVIFEALSEFDKGLCARSAALSQTETWPIPAEERETFIELALSHSDRKVSDGFGKLMLNTLCIIYDCLVPRSPNISSYDIHDSIRSLLASSFLFEAIHSFLAHRLYDNWVVYGKAYGTLMALIRELGNRRSLRDLVAKTLPRIDESSGVQVCVLYHQEPGTIWVSSTLYPITLLDAALEKRSLKEIINLETMLSEKGEKKMAETAAIIRQFFHELTVVKLLGPTSS